MDVTQLLSFFEHYDVLLVVLGFGVLGISVLMHRFDGLPGSYPLVALVLGWLTFSFLPGLTPPDAQSHRTWIVHVTELGVIISLMGVGLKIDRRPNWRTWTAVWRLLGITMIITIAATAFLGWWVLGLTPAAALLLGAVMAPTDPVLASDVQVGEPEEETQQPAEEREDEVRFALTAEAGLNDSLAFPFTYLALLVATHGLAPANWLSHWLLIDVGYRLIVGTILGLALGWCLAKILLRLPTKSEAHRSRTGVGSLAATLIIYGVTECVGGYGFLAVVIGAITIRHLEKTILPHRSLHVVAEQSEQLILTGILIAFGGAIAGGLLSSLTWQAALVSLVLVFVIRPTAGLVGLLGCSRLSWFDRSIVSFFGIRGIGSFYYLSYAMTYKNISHEKLLWSVCGLTVLISLIVHSLTAGPVMKRRAKRAKTSLQR